MSKAHEQASLEQIQREKSMLAECPKKLIQEIKNLIGELEGKVEEIFPKAEQKDRDEIH